MQELDDLRHMVESLQKTLDALPSEVLATYNEYKDERKENIAIE